MKRAIALALAASIALLPSAAVAGKGKAKGKAKGKGGYSAAAQAGKSVKSNGVPGKSNKFGKSKSTGFGGAYKAAADAPVCTASSLPDLEPGTELDPTHEEGDLQTDLPVDYDQPGAACSLTSVGDAVGALGKGKVTLFANYTWDETAWDGVSTQCTTAVTGDLLIAATKGAIDGTIADGSEVCRSAEGVSYSINFTFTEGALVKGRTSSGGALTVRGEIVTGVDHRGSFSGKASF